MNAQEVIAQALALSEVATDGPWKQNGMNGVHTPSGVCIATTHRVLAVERKADAEFIAAARTLLPVLAKALGDVLDVFDDQAVEGFGDTTAAVRIYRAITAALSEVTP